MREMPDTVNELVEKLAALTGQKVSVPGIARRHHTDNNTNETTHHDYLTKEQARADEYHPLAHGHSVTSRSALFPRIHKVSVADRSASFAPRADAGLEQHAHESNRGCHR